eukprot:1158978-Pelagomonas_calceolata.AAC.5
MGRIDSRSMGWANSHASDASDKVVMSSHVLQNCLAYLASEFRQDGSVDSWREQLDTHVVNSFIPERIESSSCP